MGNLCGSPNQEPLKPKENVGKIVSSMEKPNEPDAWRKVKLSEKLTIKNIHPCEIVRFKTGAPPEGEVNPDDSEDENKWLCNGADEEEGFVGGCKSGQKEFGYHEGTEGWQNPDLDNYDFDLCEMCVRWCIHCEKTGTDLGLIKE